MDRISYFSPGLRPLESEIRHLSGLEPQFRLTSPGTAVAIGGWGHKPTANRARRIASAHHLVYMAFEDGFLRSVEPGGAQKPLSMVFDRTGIFYDARGPSDLEIMLETADFSKSELDRTDDLLVFIRQHRLSKYNHGLERRLIEFCNVKKLVVLLDQTLGDASITGSLSDAATFERMADAAKSENPDALIIARIHPEALTRKKRGYLAAAVERLGITKFAEPVSPWCLLDLQPHIYTVSSQLGFEALLAGCKVTCFGVPFYAGWGLTDDRAIIPSRRSRIRSSRELAAAVYLRYGKYFDCWRRVPVSAETAADQLSFLRRTYLSNGTSVIGYRIARWKRPSFSAMLNGPCGPPRFTSSLPKAICLAKQTGASIAAWGADAIRLRPYLAARGISCIAVEDGFIRSAGLGAAFVQPLSLVFDRTGLYFDPRLPSDLEDILLHSNDLHQDLERADTLRQLIVKGQITKYNLRAGRPAPTKNASLDENVVLVPGQVADDWAVRLGRPASFHQNQNVNSLLLRKAREANPCSYLIFKPHPDVERLGRTGRLQQSELALADAIAYDTNLDELFIMADRIETYSSLAGFEALLRGVPVTVYGQPFYSGWGLTTDRNPPARRQRNRNLNELVASSLIRYPRYWDPVSYLPCTPEIALERLTNSGHARPAASTVRTGIARVVIWARWLMGIWKAPFNEQ